MKKKLLILVGIFVFFQFGFSLDCMVTGYEKENNKVYYHSSKKGEKIELEKADFKSFEVIEAVNFKSLARDKNHVYYAGKLLDFIDIKSFEVLEEIKPELGPVWGYGCRTSNYILKDKNGVYDTRNLDISGE